MNLGTQDVGTSITAAGTTQATATELINGVNQVTTVPSGSGVVMFAATPGTSQLVYNGGANALKVYPPSGAQIHALGLNNPMLLAPGTVVQFWFVTTILVVGILSA